MPSRGSRRTGPIPSTVTRSPGYLRASHEHLGTEHLPELRDEVLERADGSLRRVVAPELVDEPPRRDHLARAQREKREQGALFLAAHVDDATVDVDLEWPE